MPQNVLREREAESACPSIHTYVTLSFLGLAENLQVRDGTSEQQEVEGIGGDSELLRCDNQAAEMPQ